MRPLDFPLILLSGGKGTRVGSSKGLVLHQGRFWLEHQLERFLAVGGQRVVIVLGHDHKNYLLKMPWLVNHNVAINPTPEMGTFSSLLCGVRALPEDALAAFVLPVDVPVPASETWKRLAEAFVSTPASAVIPQSQLKGGHPVLLSREFLESFLKLAPDAARLDYQIRGLSDGQRITVAVKDPLIHLNMNTPEDFQKCPSRVVHHTDAIVWLKAEGTLHGASLITSLPDISEFPMFNLTQWQEWFIENAALILSSCPDDGVVIFFQSDINHEGVWIDKGTLCQKAAEKTGHLLIWKKIICRAPPGQVTFGRPQYSNLLCFSKTAHRQNTQARIDVLPDPGEYFWPRGMSTEACRVACQYVLDHTPSRRIVNPFCGQGTVLVIANQLGLDAVGIERNRKRAEKSRQI